jgi:hypothetical protein
MTARHALAEFCPDTLRPVSRAEVLHRAVRRAAIEQQMAHVAATATREATARRVCFVFLAFLLIATITALLRHA